MSAQTDLAAARHHVQVAQTVLGWVWPRYQATLNAAPAPGCTAELVASVPTVQHDALGRAEQACQLAASAASALAACGDPRAVAAAQKAASDAAACDSCPSYTPTDSVQDYAGNWVTCVNGYWLKCVADRVALAIDAVAQADQAAAACARQSIQRGGYSGPVKKRLPPPTQIPGLFGVGQPQPHGIVTVDRVLTFRKLWDPFVAAYTQAMQQVAAALDARIAHKGLDCSASGLSADDTLLCGDARWAHDNGDPVTGSVAQRWNAYKDTPDWQIVAMAGDILVAEQSTVYWLGTEERAQLVRVAERQGLQLTLPAPPTFSLQTAIIAQLEAAGIVAHGALQLLGMGVGGALEFYGAVGKKIGGAADALRDIFGSPLTWVVLGLGAAAVLASRVAPMVVEKKKKAA